MMDRYDAFLSEQYRRQDERHYAETHNLAKANGLQVSVYRRMACNLLIRSGEKLMQLGKELQPPMECPARPAIARVK